MGKEMASRAEICWRSNLPDSHSPCETSLIPYRFMERSPSVACREMHEAEYTCGVSHWTKVKLLKAATCSRIFCFIPVSLSYLAYASFQGKKIMKKICSSGLRVP